MSQHDKNNYWSEKDQYIITFHELTCYDLIYMLCFVILMFCCRHCYIYSVLCVSNLQNKRGMKVFQKKLKKYLMLKIAFNHCNLYKNLNRKQYWTIDFFKKIILHFAQFFQQYKSSIFQKFCLSQKVTVKLTSKKEVLWRVCFIIFIDFLIYKTINDVSVAI